jgi:sigma-B regulation protein RsbU (phosphoserine phosphatase)
METPVEAILREQLVERQHKLRAVATTQVAEPEITRLLKEVDEALNRMEAGSFGICEACHEPIETERLLVDPLLRFCLPHLTPAQQRAFEEDLDLACQIQQGLLPAREFTAGPWSAAYHYEPVGPVSGDYCDLVPTEDGAVYFVLGDVAGKGVAASMLMVHLHAMFRTLISVKLPLPNLISRASRVFCESTPMGHYATLVCGRASASGEVEICNAGHLPPLVISGRSIQSIEATGLPLGLFCDEQFSTAKLQLVPGDSLLLYTDGLSEAQNASGFEYSTERLMRLAGEWVAATPKDIVAACRNDVSVFLDGNQKTDDFTLLALQCTKSK